MIAFEQHQTHGVAGDVVRKTVFIVEDNASVRRALCALFRCQTDFDVCGFAENGREAIEVAGRLHPDLIVLDFLLPEMDGLDTARALKRVLPTVPLILYSAFVDDVLSEQANLIGVSEIVSKADPPSLLLQKARAVMLRSTKMPADPPAKSIPDLLLFKDVFNISPIGIAVETLDGQPLFVNPALCRFLGFAEEELQNKDCVDFFPKEDAEKDWSLFQQLKTGRIDHYQLEKEYFRRDGSLVWGRLSISLMNSHTSPLVLAMVEDITEKKTAEKALHESEERLRLAVQAGKMFAYSWDAATDVIEHSGESAEILGVDKDRTLTGADMCAMAHPDDRGRVEAALWALSVQAPTLQISYRIIRPDSTVLWVEQHIRASFDSDGKLNRLIGMIADVTDRKRAEEIRFRLAAIVESSEDAILSKTLDGVIMSWNKGAEQIYEYTEAEAVGKPVFILIPPDLVDEEKNIFERLRAGEHIEHYETSRVTKTGRRINVSLGFAQLRIRAAT
jgi:PAS domain S-box-containing protein